ncbi:MULTISPECIES: O-antigen ligase family protein [unclassified Brevundimonas]|uniref:O-antigen ligase family protein n=1 Tax=unclassified Brevundimonas TaxID=2622653 RepID=UPI0025B92B8B|nr:MULTISPECIES: O-antigen ligase family protein [unclassified Brevundimonas]
MTDTARLQDWQGRLDQDARRRGVQVDRLIALWAGAVLVLMLLYICIGPNPYQHEILVDPLTGGAEASPVNRLVWLGLFGLSAPLLWFRRQALPAMMLKLLPLLVLFAWFALTTRWALDPAVSTRRLILYAINLLICVAIAVGMGDSRRLHLAMATGCAVLVGVDILSWIAAPGVSMTPLGLAAIHSHKNTLGAVMLLAGFVCGTYAWSRIDWRGGAFWWGVTVLALVLLVASLSKTSMGLFAALACATPVIVSLMAQRRMVRWGLIAVVALMVAGVAFGWLAYCLVVGADPWAPFAGITFTQRTEVWAFVWDEFVKRPIQGWGFGSFWDIDPTVQPSLQTDAWFAQPDAYTNEAHNGFLDLAVTTGLIGLTGAVVVLMRWIFGGLILIRDAVGGDRGRLGAAILLGVFPLMVFGHNFMESSYFTANSIFGTVLLLLGVEIERRFIRA